MVLDYIWERYFTSVLSTACTKVRSHKMACQPTYNLHHCWSNQRRECEIFENCLFNQWHIRYTANSIISQSDNKNITCN